MTHTCTHIKHVHITCSCAGNSRSDSTDFPWSIFGVLVPCTRSVVTNIRTNSNVIYTYSVTNTVSIAMMLYFEVCQSMFLKHVYHMFKCVHYTICSYVFTTDPVCGARAPNMLQGKSGLSEREYYPAPETCFYMWVVCSYMLGP